MRTGGRGLAGPIAAAIVFAAVLVGLWFLVKSTTDLSPLNWFLGQPPIAIFAFVTAVWLLFALIVWWIAERTIASNERNNHEHVARLLVVMTSFFVFVLGFVVAQEWSNAISARDDFSRGSAALTTAGYDSQALPDPSKSQIRDSLRTLSYSVVCQELPALENSGLGSAATGHALEDTLNIVTNAPQNVQGDETFTQVVDELGTFSEARRAWLAQADYGLPTVIMVSILIASGLLIVAFVSQPGKSRRAQIGSLIGLVLLISVGTTMIVSLNRPFAGAAKVDPDSFTQGATAAIECGNPPKKTSAQ